MSQTNNYTFRRNVLIGYGVSLFLLIISAVASFVSISKLLEGQRWVNHTNEVIKTLNEVASPIRDGEAGQRGYLLTGNSDFLSSLHFAKEQVFVNLAKVKRLTTDNPEQQKSANAIEELAAKKFVIMDDVVSEQQGKHQINTEQLERGRKTMDSITRLIGVMQEREQLLLQERSDSTNRFAGATPWLIAIASLLAILVTIISFVRIDNDFKRRIALQNDLQQTNSDVLERIRIIEEISKRIADGDFSTRVSDADRKVLGVLSESFDKMAGSLDESFKQLANKEWQQSGIAALNELMIGERDVKLLAKKVLWFITQYTKSAVGAFYLNRDDNTLELSSGFALDTTRAKKLIQFGEGVAGQSASLRQQVMLEIAGDIEVTVDYSGASFKPKAVLAFPIFFETRLKGVLELATLTEYTHVVQDFLKSAAFNIGMAIHSANDYHRLQDLLNETQAQSEELQSQHSELENVNAELQAQAEKLQASEEELKVQQEELQQANQELEERSRLLEEKNELILERNLDIQRKAEELELSTKYKSEFLANMSHELRTPLNSILLLSRLLSENHEHNLSDDQVEYADVIQSSGKGLLTLIDEILDLSKIESGKMALEFGDVNVEDVTAELHALFDLVAKEKDVQFEIQIEPGTSQAIETDRLRLEQILRNFLSNALKFTKKGSVALRVAQNGNVVLFSVKDTGIGIPKEKQHIIFEAFQQADGSTRRQYGGTGLGLSISRELAKLLGGYITLESAEGQGSTFTLAIPVKRAIDTVAEPAKDSLTESPAESKQETVSVLSPLADSPFIAEHIPPSIPDDRDAISPGDKIILIVEDDTAFAKSLLDYTRLKGYKGIVTVRGDEAILLARQYKPVGILLDVQLPVKSGWDVMETLKADKQTRPIPVHMMSSFEVKNKSLSKGAVDFINKPVAFEKLGEMFQKIEHALSRSPKKVLIVEENPKHAQALAYFLGNYDLTTEIRNTVDEGVRALNSNEVDCVILDMGIPAQRSYELLEGVKRTPGLEHLPIIVFTGKNLSHVEEMKIKQYADSIVVKTAHSYQRILDEVSLFLHLVEENTKELRSPRYKKLGALNEVLKDKTVLVADDDVRNIFSLTRALEGYGMNVISATDGKEAVAQLEEHPATDLILMDMMMPAMDGYDAIKKIREKGKYRNLPIIAVTAKAMTGDREKCIAAGASDYITKPVDLDQLISLLRVWLYQ